MYLKLTRNQEASYAYTIADDGIVIFRQAFTQEDIDGLLADFRKKSDKFSITHTPDKGDGTFYIREKIPTLHVDEAEVKKLAVEFNRFKQDCRKKSLDAAIQSFPDLRDAKEIKKFADIFYKWLIDIPE